MHYLEKHEAKDVTDDICRDCGACCAPGIIGQKTEGYVEVMDDDLRRGFRFAAELQTKDLQIKRPTSGAWAPATRRFLPTVRAHNDFTQCEHLEGEVLKDARCGCYELRPNACRYFEPGGVTCLELRKRWMAHKERVFWLVKRGFSHVEAVFRSARELAQAHDKHAPGRDPILSSLGREADYALLQRRRDEAELPQEWAPQGKQQTGFTAADEYAPLQASEQQINEAPEVPNDRVGPSP